MTTTKQNVSTGVLVVCGGAGVRLTSPPCLLLHFAQKKQNPGTLSVTWYSSIGYRPRHIIPSESAGVNQPSPYTTSTAVVLPHNVSYIHLYIPHMYAYVRPPLPVSPELKLKNGKLRQSYEAPFESRKELAGECGECRAAIPSPLGSTADDLKTCTAHSMRRPIAPPS